MLGVGEAVYINNILGGFVMKKRFASVLSVLLCCAFFAGCSAKEPYENKTDYVSDFLNAGKYIGMSEEKLLEDGFVLNPSSSSDSYEKTISTVYSVETDVTVLDSLFVFYFWSFSDVDEALEQAEEINDQFIKKLDNPTCEYNGKSVDYNSNVLSSSFNKSGDFELKLTYHDYYIDGYKAPFSITFTVSYDESREDLGVDCYSFSLFLGFDTEAAL